MNRLKMTPVILLGIAFALGLGGLVALFGLTLALLPEWHVHRYQKAWAALHSGSGSHLDPALGGPLVYLSEARTSPVTLTDPDFQVVASGLRLRRIVRQYRLVDHRWSYKGRERRDMVEEWVDPSGGTPGFGVDVHGLDRGLRSRTFGPDVIAAGGWQLGPEFLDRLEPGEPVIPPATLLDGLPPAIRKMAYLDGGLLHLAFGGRPRDGKPALRNVAVRWACIPGGPHSLLARPEGRKLFPARDFDGKPVLLIAPGPASASSFLFQLYPMAKGSLASRLAFALFGFCLGYGGLRIVTGALPLPAGWISGRDEKGATLLMIALGLAWPWFDSRPVEAGAMVLDGLVGWLLVRRAG